MQTLKEVLTIVMPIFALVYLGYFFKHIKIGNDRWIKVINAFVYYVSLPAIIISSFWQINVLDVNLAMVVLANLLVLIVFAFVIFAALEFFGSKKGEIKAAVFMVALVGNTVYMGFPLIHRAFTQEYVALAIAAAAIHLVSGILFSILAVEYWVVKSKQPLVYFKDVIKNPLFASLAVGILLSLLKFKGGLAEAVLKPINMLGATASPLALFALGGFLHGKFIKHRLKESLLATMLKLILLPLVFWASFWYMGAVNKVVAMSVLLASMPSAVTAFVIAEQYKLDHELVANSILLSTAFSVITISIFLTFFI